MKKVYTSLIFYSFFLVACNESNQGQANMAIGPDSQPSNIDGPSNSQTSDSSFSKTVSYKEIAITVESPGLKKGNYFFVKTKGLSAANLDDKVPIQGRVEDLLIDDIDGDDGPEVFIIVTDVSGFSRIYGYSANGKKSMSMINVPDMAAQKQVKGFYKTGAEFMPVENSFVVRFPLYMGDSNTGKTRQLQYKLKKGEAAKQLVLNMEIEY